VVTIPTYDSEGLLYKRQQQNLFTGAVTAQTQVFYFAGRPVAQLDGPPATGVLTYLAVDHLGTPILASIGAAAATWSGGVEPFGRDFSTPSAQSSGIFLRLPGQWDDTVWDNMLSSSGLYYNLNRWYGASAGRYMASDQVGLGDRNLYLYARANPLQWSDPLGLSPRPSPRFQRKTRDCRSEEIWQCEEMCGPRGMESCKVWQTFRPTRSKNGVTKWEWVDQNMSCSCHEEPDWLARRCVRNLKQNLNEILQWLADHPPASFPGPIPGSPGFPVTDPF
jgi:RHS repeat-associated protein